MSPQPKRKRLALPKYLDWLKDKPCCVCGKEPYADHKSIPHHCRVNGSGGTGIKPSDTYALPLCHKCHDSLHRGCRLFLGGEEYVDMVELLTEFLSEK